VGFRRFVALPVLAGLAGTIGVVALGATTFADPAEPPAVGGQLLAPDSIQIMLAPPAAANTAVPPSTTAPIATDPSNVEQFAVTAPTPPTFPTTDPQATTTPTTTPKPPDLLTGLMGALGLPTTPCTGPDCDQTNVGCEGGSPFCFQIVR
jgi:hypothetical protein